MLLLSPERTVHLLAGHWLLESGHSVKTGNVVCGQGGLLSALGSLAMIAWLGMTPHSPESERKRLAILAGFAFLTGMRARWQLPWSLVVAPLLTPFDAPPPLRSGSGPHSGLCHCRQSQVSDAGGGGREQSGAARDCGCLLSIIATAFMGTSVIFVCFTLSALYAKRRSYLFLGGEGQSVGGGSARLGRITLSHCSAQVP